MTYAPTALGSGVLTLAYGSGCQLDLSYMPPAYAAPGTLMLGYSYVNDAGFANTGTAIINYSAN